MLYDVFMYQAMALVIVDDSESSGYYYLDPHYRSILMGAGLDPANVTDQKLDWDYVREVLDLEVKRRNQTTDKTRYVIDWVFDVVTSSIDPMMVSEENELMKNMMNYMKLNHEINEREREVKRMEDAHEQKSNIVELIPGINFSKRGAK